MMVLDHVSDLKVFYGNMVIAFSVLFGHLEMVIAALTLNLQMRLCCTRSRLTTAMGTFLTTTHGTLLASQGFLRGAIEAWVSNGMALTIRQERFQPYINTDVRMRAFEWGMLGMWLRLTDEEGVPMPISTMDEMYCLGCTLYPAMHLDLEKVSQLLGNDEVFVVFVQIAIFAVLPELNGMPAIGLLETREANTRDSILFCSKKAFEGLGETISKHLNGGGRYMFALPFKGCFQVILAGKCFVLLILRFYRLKHEIRR